MFSGRQSVTNARLAANKVAVPFDISRDVHYNDINNSCGFLHALHMLMKVRPGGAHFTAPVCSSWVFMNRSTSKRSATRPGGDTSSPSVSYSNKMVARVCLLLWVAAAKQIVIILEQPR
eukprot:929209-Alexandrium_andersonii.AAC.1